MTTEQLREYLDDGGTDERYVLEWILDYTDDETIIDMGAHLFANIEAQ